jgi:hypothetical protein
VKTIRMKLERDRALLAKRRRKLYPPSKRFSNWNLNSYSKCPPKNIIPRCLKRSHLLTYLGYFRTMFDTTEPTLERIKAFRIVEYADGLLIKLGSKEAVSSQIDF